jgi:hypothetical protein
LVLFANCKKKDLDKFCYNNKERYWKYKNKDRKENKSKNIILNIFTKSTDLTTKSNTTPFK